MRAFPFRVLTGAALATAGALASAAQAQQTVRLPGQDRVLPGRPTTVFSVGEAEGRDWEMFSGPLLVDFDRDENLYVLDSGNQRVVVFDRSGGFVRTFGKRGGGPGELQRPVQIAVTRENEVVISDIASRAFVVYSREGRYLRSVAFSESGAGLPGTTLEAHPTRGVITTVLPMGFPASQQIRSISDVPQGRTSRTTSLLWNPLQPNARSAVMFQAPEEVVRTAAEDRRGDAEKEGSVRVAANTMVTFAPRLHYAVLGSTVAVSSGAGYAVSILDANGRVQRVLQRPITPRRVTERDRELARQRQAQALGAGSPQLRGVQQQMLSGMQFAEVMPVIRGMAADPAGRYWIGRSAPAGQNEGGPIDLVTPAGEYVGTLRGELLPRVITPSGRAAYVERDELGVERVVVKALPASWRR